MNNDLKLIKKYYGEKFSHLCRDLFPTILEKPGVLYNLIASNFYHNKFLYDDILNNGLEKEFKYFIYSKTQLKTSKPTIVTKTPFELMDEAGYVLYECKTEEDIQSFKKYYLFGEKLCTFNGGRLDNCYVFFAVKKNVDKIKREDFDNPRRQDEYGTSVISIQFTKDEYNTLSIKNRYNHTVNNPDATFSNNLDNIIPGLTEAFNKYYSLNTRTEQNDFEIPNYVRAHDNKLYKYNLEMGNAYFCPDNIIIDHFVVTKYEKEIYIVFENYVLDIHELKITEYVHNPYNPDNNDSFITSLGDIKKIEQKLNENTNTRLVIINDDIIIELNSLNQIISYINPKVKIIDRRFLMNNKTLINISLPNVIAIQDFFLYYNRTLQNINLPKVKIIKDECLRYNNSLKKLYLPKLITFGNNFLIANRNLEYVSIPKLKKVEEISKNKYLCDELHKNDKIRKLIINAR